MYQLHDSLLYDVSNTSYSGTNAHSDKRRRFKCESRSTAFRLLLLVNLIAGTAVAQFLPPDPNVVGDPNTYMPVMAVSQVGDDVVYHLAYYTRFTPNNQVKYIRSLDEGISWEDPVVFDSMGDGDFDVSIAANGQFVYVFWATGNVSGNVDSRIYVTSSSDRGQNFDDPVALPGQPVTGNFRRLPRVAVDSTGTLHVVWNRDAAPDVLNYVQGTFDAGTITWEATQLIEPSRFRPTIFVASDDSVYVVAQFLDGDIQVFQKNSTGVADSNWSLQGAIAGVNASPVKFPQVAEDSQGRLYVAFENGPSDDAAVSGFNDITVAHSDNSGVTWTSVTIDSGNAVGYMPDIAVGNNDEVQVIWQSPRAGSDMDFETGGDIRFARSADRGVTWGAAFTLNTSVARNISFSGFNNPPSSYGDSQPLLGVPSILFHGEQTTAAWVNQGGTPTNSLVIARERPGAIMTVAFNPANGFFIAPDGSVEVVVTVFDGGNPVQGDSIAFGVTAGTGAGTFDSPTVTTDDNGEARAVYTGGGEIAAVQFSVQNETDSSLDAQTFVVQQGLIDHFDLGSPINADITGLIGVNLQHFAIVTDADVSALLIQSPPGALRLGSDGDFADDPETPASADFIIGGEMRFKAPITLTSAFNTLEYCVISESDDPDPDDPTTDFLCFVQLIMANDSVWEQIIQTPVTTSFQQVRIPLDDTIGFTLAEGSTAGSFDLTAVSGIRYFLNRNQNTAGGRHDVFFDDVSFRFFEPGDIDHFDVVIGDNSDDAVNPFINATIPVHIIPRNAVNACVDLPVPIPITVTSNHGSLDMLLSGDVVTEIGLDSDCGSPGNVVHAVIPDLTTDTNVDFTVAFDDGNAVVTGATTATLRNGTVPDGELAFLAGGQDTATAGLAHEGMVASFPNSGSAFTFSNAMSVIAFVHRGAFVDAEPLDFAAADMDPDPGVSPFLARAHAILSAFADTTVQIDVSDADNGGGFYDQYNLDGTPVVNRTSTTGNNAWMMMAINHYTLFTGDGQFQDMAEKLVTYLINRQATSGGVFTRANDPLTFVTEHQGQAYSAFRFYADLPWVVASSEAGRTSQDFLDRAGDVRDFIIDDLLVTDPVTGHQRFLVAGGINPNGENTAADAQTSPFLALRPDDFSTAIDFLFHQDAGMLSEQVFNDRLITGMKFKKMGQNVWIEGSSQVALASKIIALSAGAEQSDIDRLNLMLTNIQKVQHGSGGYPNFLGTETDDGVSVGSSKLSASVATWKYFSEVDPPLNPYNLSALLTVRQDRVFTPSNGVVMITATLRQPSSIDQQDIVFTVAGGTAGLGAAADSPAPQGTLTVATNSNGVATAFFIPGDTPDVTRIIVSVPSSTAAAREIFVLADFVENFEQGEMAGGTLSVFGNARDEAVDVLQDGLARAGSGDTVAVLATGSTGFTAADNAIVLSKTFASVLSGGSPTTTIDASDFNAVSYWIRNSAASASQVVLELIIGDGGGFDGSTGSTWRQAVAADVPTDWTRVVRHLDDTEFTRTTAHSGGGATLDRTMISAVNIVFVGNEVGGAQTLLVDDVNFFRNTRIKVQYVDRVFAKGGSDTVFTLVATVDTNDALEVNFPLRVSTLGDGTLEDESSNTGDKDNPLVIMTDDSGQARFTYSAVSHPEVGEIVVEVAE